FTATDGLLTSNPATVTFTMGPVNRPPVADLVPPLLIDEDTPTTVFLSARDADGDQLTFQITTQPTHGSIGVIQPIGSNTATVVYSSAANYHGSDHFTFEAKDNSHES